LPEKLQTRPTASERVKPRYMTPYNLNKNKIRNTNKIVGPPSNLRY
jgi:hypothetical protein